MLLNNWKLFLLLVCIISWQNNAFSSSIADSTILENSVNVIPDTLSAQADTATSTTRPNSSTTDTLGAKPVYSILTDSLILKPETSYFTEVDTITIAMAGDVMLGTNYPSPKYLPPGNDCRPLLEPVHSIIRKADLAFCNLEGVFAGEAGTPKKCNNPESCYVFRMPEEYSSCIADAGFDFVSVANNHVNDFGYGGRINAEKVLDSAGIHFAGFSDKPYTIFESNGLLIGFCAFSPNQGVQDLRDIPAAEKITHFLEDSCDIVIVSMHGGAEGAKYQYVTRETETFLGANRGNVYEFAHRMIDAGADIVIGHGPHVTRAMEIYKDRFIAYSLGNFSTYSRFNISGPNGIAPLVTLEVDREGKFLGGKVTPIYQTGEGGAKPDPQNRVIFKLQDLMLHDFPEGILRLTDDGRLYTVTRTDSAK